MAEADAQAQKAPSEFGKRYSIDYAKPLKEFDTPGGHAFAVRDNTQPGRSLYAFIHEPGVPVRRRVFKVLRGNSVGNIVTIQDQGIMQVRSMSEQQQRMVTIFDRPRGPALMDRAGRLHPKVTASLLRQTVVLTALKTLAALHKKGLTHRNIHPQRIYFVSNESSEIMFGECYSAPAGMGQPDGLEALELVFAEPAGRGEGTPAADFFQLGASLACLFHNRKLWEQRDAKNFVLSRVNQSSLSALTRGAEIPGALGAAVRGLMADERSERWGAVELLDWYEGTVKNKRVGLKTWALNRPTSFNGVSYVDRRLLAHAMAENPDEAAVFLRKVDFPSWCQASLRDEIITDKHAKMLGLYQTGNNYTAVSKAEDRKLVTRFCLFLYPIGPVRYKNYSLYLDGFGTLLAHAFNEDNKDLISVLTDLLDVRFLTNLRDIAGGHNQAFISQVNALRDYAATGKSKQLSSGIERILYLANPDLPCLSQKFTNYWANSIKQIILILDDMNDAAATRTALTDRHIAAFMAAHGNGLDREFNKIAAAKNDPAKQALLAMDLFGALQRATKIENLPNLTTRLVEALAPAMRGLKNRKRREQVQGMIDKVKKDGSITKMSSELNLSQVAAQDAREFARARNEIIRLERERVKLSKKILPTDPQSIHRGYQIGRWTAFTVLALVVMVAFF